VLIVAPKKALTAEDFRAVSRTVDPYISENGKITGLLIEAPSFPRWDSFAALTGSSDAPLRCPRFRGAEAIT
jgi:hypothetical protein